MADTTVALPGLKDLTREFPRSPGATLGPFVILPRILDKCRAVITGVNGEYNFNCYLDRKFFDMFEVDAEAFKAEVASGKTDEQMLSWVQENRAPKSDEEILLWCYEKRTERPETDDRKAYFEKMRQTLCPGNPWVETWFQMLDADEGRWSGRNPLEQ